MSARKRTDRTAFPAAAIMVLIVFIIVAVSVFIRLQLAGGEWSCIASSDPAICAAVKELGR